MNKKVKIFLNILRWLRRSFWCYCSLPPAPHPFISPWLPYNREYEEPAEDIEDDKYKLPKDRAQKYVRGEQVR